MKRLITILLLTLTTTIFAQPSNPMNGNPDWTVSTDKYILLSLVVGSFYGVKKLHINNES